MTRELFQLKKVNGLWTLQLGTKRKDLGALNVKWHRKPRPDQLPNSLWIRVVNGRWTVSFSYDDGHLEESVLSSEEHLAWLSQCSEKQLEDMITPIDRGIARPIQTHNKTYAPTKKALKKQKGREKYIKRCQRKLARQKKGSVRSKKTKKKIAKLHNKTVNVRNDFLHKSTTETVNDALIIVLENLKLGNMTLKAKAKQCPDTGRWLRNGARAKSGLNKSLLGVGLYRMEEFITYKAYRQNKPVFKVNPMNTSRECSACGNIQPENRLTQAKFQCQSCGHTDNADRNAALVIRKRAIKLIKHSGTELVGAKKNVLRPGTDANLCKTPKANADGATDCPLKKTAPDRI